MNSVRMVVFDKKRSLFPGPGIEWVVEANRLLLRKDRAPLLVLEYPEAAIWDLVLRGYRYPKLLSMLAHISGLAEKTEPWLDRTLSDWLERELLCQEARHG